MFSRTALIGVLAIAVGVYYDRIEDSFSQIRTILLEKYGISQPTEVWLEERLVKYKHLVILGHVFDVSSAPQFYGKDGHYNFFTGVDATRAFASSDLSAKSLIPIVEGLPMREIVDAFNWLKEFKKKYPHIGYLHGPYFDTKGKATTYYHRLQQEMRAYLQTKADEDALYPSCNVNSAGDQSAVDCVDGYNEARYPRLLITPSEREPRCACLTQNFLSSGKTRLYPKCGEFDRVCKFSHEDLEAVLKSFSVN